MLATSVELKLQLAGAWCILLLFANACRLGNCNWR
jgi:hypothetical protein